MQVPGARVAGASQRRSSRRLHRASLRLRRAGAVLLKAAAGMDRKQPQQPAGCCGVEAVVTVDARGQIVLPKELRDGAGIATGDKLAVVSLRNGERLCCLALMKVEELAGTVREILNPVASQLIREEKDHE